ncbi:GH-E family nuclease [Moraxella sp. ZY200743]|uniref:GH-E family nuclease n=1 Tax=Moraxella sp. ZY200743 TaxID=2911970 RepID=UPI003D7E7F96
MIKAPIDIGHAYGREHRRLKILAHEFHLTQSQFNDFINAHPEYFRLENMYSNRSHSGEMPGNAIPSQLRQDMINFCKKHQCGVKK